MENTTTAYTWKKGFFSRNFQLLQNGEAAGKLKIDNWGRKKARGQLNGIGFYFKSKGFFSSSVMVIDQNDLHVATITFGNWNNKATLQLHTGEQYTWRNSNFWNTKWKLTGSNGQEINYSGSSSSGSLAAAIPDELLILSGLYIRNHFWQMAAAAVAIFAPLLVNQLY